MGFFTTASSFIRPRAKSLYVNLFIPSTLTWTERKISVPQVTDFPHADTTKLIFNGSGQFDVKVRVPGWVTRGYVVKINGKEQSAKAKPCRASGQRAQCRRYPHRRVMVMAGHACVAALRRARL